MGKKCNNIDILINRSLGNSIDDRQEKIKNKFKGPTKHEKNIAEKILLRKIYTGSRIIQPCRIPRCRAISLVVFSSDGTKLAAINGDRNVYLIDVATNKVVKVLEGHVKDPCTIAFHPTNNNVLASGCFDGAVIIWNLKEDSHETWLSPGRIQIDSLSFHPRMNLLAIATDKKIFFIDWKAWLIFGQSSTNSPEEKLRYVKFDSTGDKLITAVSSDRLLCEYDSIAFREVFQYCNEQKILKDIKFIQKFCENRIHKLESDYNKVDAEELKTVSVNIDVPKKREYRLMENVMPYLCEHHLNNVTSILNVDCFCPAEFSMQILNMVRESKLTTDNLVTSCYICRYIWLYGVIFQFSLTKPQTDHICESSYRCNKDHHVWSFNSCRFEELKQENVDQVNGVTEETLKYCFEHFAKVKISPYFAKSIPDGVCSKIKYGSLYGDCFHRFRISSYAREKAMRSDCFLHLCKKFGFKPTGSFIPLLNSFSMCYNYLQDLQQISTEEDFIRLSTIMTEWEYLYCKFLLINNIIDGDNGMISTKRIIKEQSSFRDMFNQFDEIQVVDEKINSGASTSNSEFCDNKMTNKEDFEERPKRCDLCDNSNTDNETSCSFAMQLLRKDIDILSSEIMRRGDAKVQRLRIEKLYKQQIETKIQPLDGRIFTDIERRKRNARNSLSMFVTELKKFLRVNLCFIEVKAPFFQKTYVKLFIFIVKRTVTFIRSVLDFFCDYKYNIKELLEIGRGLIKSARAIPLFTLKFEDFNREDNRVFEEENVSFSSDLSDDESNIKLSEKIVLTADAHAKARRLFNRNFHRNCEELIDSLMESVKASRSYIDQHLKLIKCISDGMLSNDHHSLFKPEFLNSKFDLNRLQVWDFSRLQTPEISNKIRNIVVPECQVYNDASIAISNDNKRVAVLLSPNLRILSHWIGVFSLEKKTVGEVLCAVPLNKITVSLSFSPTDRYLAAGFSFQYCKDLKKADIVSIQQEIDGWRNFNLLNGKSPVATSLVDINDFSENSKMCTVKCIRWCPKAGQGLIVCSHSGHIRVIM